MPQPVSRAYLYLLVFTGGFTTLGLELSASRLLDPWFGNSLIVWASLIGLIMLYLSVGYWLGGRLADRSPHLLTLLRLAGLGALGVGLVPAGRGAGAAPGQPGLGDLDAGLLAGSMGGILVLFAIPVTLLGCVSPFAIRLGLREISGSGEFAGRVYALSTAGSILGSFLPVLLLIPNIGTRRTFATLAAALLLVILAGLLRIRRRWESLAGIVAVALRRLAGLAAGRADQAGNGPALRNRVGLQLHPGRPGRPRAPAAAQRRRRHPLRLPPGGRPRLWHLGLFPARAGLQSGALRSRPTASRVTSPAWPPARRRASIPRPMVR